MRFHFLIMAEQTSMENIPNGEVCINYTQPPYVPCQTAGEDTRLLEAAAELARDYTPQPKHM